MTHKQMFLECMNLYQSYVKEFDNFYSLASNADENDDMKETYSYFRDRAWQRKEAILEISNRLFNIDSYSLFEKLINH